MTTTINNKIRNLNRDDIQNITDKLFSQSKEGKDFKKLLPLITTESNILLAFYNIKNNSGSKSPGIDKITIEQIGNMNVNEVINLVNNKLKNYNPKPIKQIEITKSNGDKRKIGIPCMIDRLIQQCILQIIEPICEAKFYSHSYGFRPARGTKDAMARIYFLIQKTGLYYAIDAEVVDLFRNVKHSKLVKQLWSMGIQDKQLLSVIKAMLKAKIVLPNGKEIFPQKGIVQCGILSPILSNVVLNELDWWIASQWDYMKTTNVKPRVRLDKNKPYIDRGNITQSLKRTNLKEMYIIRYADDFRILCRKKHDAEKLKHALEEWVNNRLNLKIDTNKLKIVNLKRNYISFLGFEIKAVKKGNKWVVSSNVSKQSLKRVKNELKNIISKIQKSRDGRTLFELINQYNATIIGVHNYYSVATNVSINFRKMGSELRKIWYTRCRSSYKLSRDCELQISSSIDKKYGKSEMLFFVNERPIVPIGYIKTKPPMNMDQKKTPYTVEGRILLNKNLDVDPKELRVLMTQKTGDKSLEYYDNRISLYCAQNGKCAITGQPLKAHEINCHHKIPKSEGGNDKIDNLIIVSQEIHILIHANTKETIDKYIEPIKDEKQLEKINKLRSLCKLDKINM